MQKISHSLNHFPCCLLTLLIHLQFKIGRIHFRKKEIYLGLSFVLCIFLFGILVNDFISILEKEMPENTTQGFTLTILVSVYVTPSPQTNELNLKVFIDVDHDINISCFISNIASENVSGDLSEMCLVYEIHQAPSSPICFPISRKRRSSLSISIGKCFIFKQKRKFRQSQTS